MQRTHTPLQRLRRLCVARLNERFLPYYSTGIEFIDVEHGLTHGLKLTELYARRKKVEQIVYREVATPMRPESYVYFASQLEPFFAELTVAAAKVNLGKYVTQEHPLQSGRTLMVERREDVDIRLRSGFRYNVDLRYNPQAGTFKQVHATLEYGGNDYLFDISDHPVTQDLLGVLQRRIESGYIA